MLKPPLWGSGPVPVALVNAHPSLVEGLRRALDDGYELQVATIADIPDVGIVVQPHATPATVASVRASHRAIGLIVTLGRARHADAPAVLDAGADACLTEPTVAELALYVVVVGRRLFGPTRGLR